MTSAIGAAPRLEFLLGRADGMRAEVYVRLVGGREDAEVSATLVGPQCRLATTLPATTVLRPLSGGGTAAAHGIVTEPSFWTPDLPNLYELLIETREGTGVVATTRRIVGLRRLGVRGRALWLDGHRWVPRARSSSVTTFVPAVYRTERLVAMIADPTADACSAADAAGVALIARLDHVKDPAEVAERVAQLSQHPAAVMTVIDDRCAAAIDSGRSKGTMLVAVEVDAGDPPPSTLPAGIDCLVVRLARNATPADAWRDHSLVVPIVASRQGEGGGRRACDALQAELAAWGCAGARSPAWDWAGYIVS